MGGDKRTRKHRRIGVNLWVSHESVQSFRADPADNLSAGGVFVCTTRPLPIGTVVYMNIRLSPDGSEAINAVGEVAWHRDASQDGQLAGMGISFTRIDDRARLRLDEFIATQDPPQDSG